MKNLLKAIVITGMLVFSLSTFSHADLINGNFSSGLTGWTTTGSVAVENGVAVLREGADGYTGLYQQAALASGSYLLQFDYLISSIGPAIAIDENTFSTPDIYASTLYFYSDPSSDFSDYINLFQVSGPSNLDSTAWYHFSLTFENQYSIIVPTFELFDMNSINGDSTVSIDNVSISQVASVPEPGTLFFLVLGLVGLIIAERKRHLICSR